MAKPRVFISSTYYDLRHLRSAFEAFIERFGFEPVLSEKGNIAYAPDIYLDESCYREVEHVDLFVLIIGGRYGSERAFGNSARDRERKIAFYDRYDSITREEFRTAIKNDIPTYILIDRAVNAEYHTFTKNRDSNKIHYAHVDSVNIFRMIDEIVLLPRNNPIFEFGRYHEIEQWLREQWSSLFKELLRRTSNHEQLKNLASQVSQLNEVNQTLRRYIERIMPKVAPESQDLITSETRRLSGLESLQHIADNGFVQILTRRGIELAEIGKFLTKAKSVKSLFESVKQFIDDEGAYQILNDTLDTQKVHVIADINKARRKLGLKELTWGESKGEVE